LGKNGAITTNTAFQGRKDQSMLFSLIFPVIHYESLQQRWPHYSADIGIDGSSPNGECRGSSDCYLLKKDLINTYPPAYILRRLGTMTLIVSLSIHTPNEPRSHAASRVYGVLRTESSS
jgi:hypothetical protein